MVQIIHKSVYLFAMLILQSVMAKNDKLWRGPDATYCPVGTTIDDTFNVNQYRLPQRQLAKDTKTFKKKRIAFIGDSITEGCGGDRLDSLLKLG